MAGRVFSFLKKNSSLKKLFPPCRNILSLENYPLFAYVTEMLGSSYFAKQTILPLSGYHQDTSGHFNSTAVENAGRTKRMGLFGATVGNQFVYYNTATHLVSRLPLFLPFIPLLLNTTITIEMDLSSPDFYLSAADDAADATYVLEDISLFIMKYR